MDRAISGYLVEASRRLDHEDFKLQSLAQFHGSLTVPEWAELVESRVITVNSARTLILEYPEAYLKSTSNAIFWEDAEIIFHQSMNRARYDPLSGPVTVGRVLVFDLSAHINRSGVLITDLLPKLIELELFDLQMQAVLRRKWIMIDLILDRWFAGDRTSCEVPRW